MNRGIVLRIGVGFTMVMSSYLMATAQYYMRPAGTTIHVSSSAHILRFESVSTTER